MPDISEPVIVDAELGLKESNMKRRSSDQLIEGDRKIVKATITKRATAKRAPKSTRSNKSVKTVTAVKHVVNPAPSLPLKILAAFTVDEGVFVVVALPIGGEQIQSFARYVEKPVPHLVSDRDKNCSRLESVGTAIFYGAFISMPIDPTVLSIKLGAVTSNGKKAVFEVIAKPWGSTDSATLIQTVRTFGKLLIPLFRKALIVDHPLLQNLSKSNLAQFFLKPANENHAPQNANIIGNFDGIVDEKAHGWAYNKIKPDEKLFIEILAGEELVGSGIANVFRYDLRENGIGEGENHFKINLSAEIFDGRSHNLRARIQNGDYLAGSFEVLLPDRREQSYDRLDRATMLALASTYAKDVKLRDRMLAMIRAASLAQELGDYSAAENSYLQAIDFAGENPVILCRLAEIKIIDKNLTDALDLYKKASVADDKLGWAKLGVANVQRLLNDPISAYRTYGEVKDDEFAGPYANKRLLEVLPSAAIKRSNVLVSQKAFEEAASILTKAALIVPENNDLLETLFNVIRTNETPSRQRNASTKRAYMAATLAGAIQRLLRSSD